MLDQYQKQFIKLAEQNARSHRMHVVFCDFCEMSAIALSNLCDKTQYEKREARYMEIVGKYTKEEANRFAEMHACIENSLTNNLHDCLGELFMSLELGSHFNGQFFTPFHIASLMARLTVGNDADAALNDKGFITVMEPAAGAGCMLIAQAQVMMENKINYQQAMHATAIDIDATAVHMCYVQLSLLGMPAVIYHGNTLSNEFWSYWKTPMHVLGLWDYKVTRSAKHPADLDAIKMPEVSTPADMPAPIVELANRAVSASKNKQENQLALF